MAQNQDDLPSAQPLSGLPNPAGGSSEPNWNRIPVKALLLGSPQPGDVDLFCRFVRDVLPKEGVNTLVLLIRYRYQFQSHPELADKGAITRADLCQILDACRDAGVKLVPKMNLLGHQSDMTQMLPLLAKYPDLDESPDYNPPDPWHDEGLYGFYCKSLCPQHPALFPLLFDLMDELIEVCQADSFHVGLDEVWIIAYPKCPFCGGQDPAEVFAAHVRRLRDHLTTRRCRMWMWSDRLIDAKTTRLGPWQASMNNTYRAIDMIPKDIVMCDWHYEDAPPTHAYFAVKGFDVLACPWNEPDVAVAQLDQICLLRANGARAEFSAAIASHFLGMFQTSWMNAADFIRLYHDTEAESRGRRNVETFKALFAEIRRRGA